MSFAQRTEGAVFKISFCFRMEACTSLTDRLIKIFNPAFCSRLVSEKAKSWVCDFLLPFFKVGTREHAKDALNFNYDSILSHNNQKLVKTFNY